jgi:hypothetical protein
MKHNSQFLLAKLLEKGGIRFKSKFFESVNKVPKTYRKPMFELILDAFFSVQRRRCLIQVFVGVVYAPEPFYFTLYFEKPTHGKTLFYDIKQIHSIEFIEDMGPGVYADERHKMKLASIGLPISWRAELNSMNYN